MKAQMSAVSSVLYAKVVFVVNFIVMVKLNTPVFPHTDISSGSASATSDSTSPASAAALDTAFSLTQQLDGIKSLFADVFAESCELPPDRGVEHVIPLEPDAKPPFKHMYRLSSSELVEVK